MLSLFKKQQPLHPAIIRAPLRGHSSRELLGEALAPKTDEQRKREWRDRFLEVNPGLNESDLLNLEAQGNAILSDWRKRNGRNAA